MKNNSPLTRARNENHVSLWKIARLLVKSLRQFKAFTIWAVVLTVFQTAFETAIPFVAALMIDRFDTLNKAGTTDPAVIWPQLGIYGGLLLGLALLSFAVAFSGTRLSARASVGFAANMRKDIFHKTQSFSFENIDSFSVPSLVTRQTTDINNMQQAFLVLIRVAVSAPLTLFFSLGLSLYYASALSWVYAITIPFVVISVAIIFAYASRIFARAFPKYDDLNKSVEENVRGIRTVKTYAREEYEKMKFASASGNIKKLMMKAEVAIGISSPVTNAAFCISITLFLVFGSLAIMNGTSSLGALTAMISLGSMILFSLIMMSYVLVIVSISTASARRIHEVLVQVPGISDPSNPINDIQDGSIIFRKVSFGFNGLAGKLVLHDIDLQIQAGRTIGIIGGTGSAKSTLVSMIPRFYDPRSGKVMVGGRDVRDYGLKALRKAVAMVLQKNVLFSGTVGENLRWGNADATIEELDEACQLAQATEFVSSLPGKYDYVIDQGGANLSGGQKQRLCIARALLKKPKILIFDDSTSAVDTETDAAIKAGLEKTMPQATKIIIAQRVSSVIDADEIIVMEDGRISGRGSARELYRMNKAFREVCDIQGMDLG